MATATHGSDREASAPSSTFAKGALVAAPMTLSLWILVIVAWKAIL